MSEEYITKTQVRELMERYYENANLRQDHFLRSVFRDIKALPPADVSPPHWINVQDRLPEQDIQCLIWTDKGWCGFGSCGIYDGEAEWDTESYWAEEDGLVTHWMPLPEPPGGDAT